MPKRMMLALFLATLAVGPATAQQAENGGVRTETMSRLAGENSGFNTLWNVIGLLGLLGLIGLLPKHEDDSYHPASLD
ncbi:MAG TPA: WGxxGxxG family protein [Sphingomicrobium sp.]|nr:WGxxGxxG family protein [Sphingomicrobium sp.]